MQKHLMFGVFLSLIVFEFCLSTLAQNLNPVLEGCTPTKAAVNTVLQCDGLRLGAEVTDPTRVRATFVRGAIRIAGRASGSRYIPNDLQSGPQTLSVVVPEQITPGRWQLVIEVGEWSSEPVMIEVADWTPPNLSSLMPERVSRGEFVFVYGGSLHVNDEIEITDSLGHVRRFSAGASGSSTGFTVSRDMPDGEAWIRVGLTARNSFSQPLKLVVTSGPVALELWPDQMTKVAPGQWTDLVVTTLKPAEDADKVEVEFRRGEQAIIQSTLKSNRTHVRVPATLKPGSIELRTRTSLQGLASDWSRAISYEILEHPVGPSVWAIEMGDKANPVFLWEGPDRPTNFEVEPGYALTLRGDFPVGSPEQLRIIFQRNTEQLAITPVEGERGGKLLNLPGDMGAGDWKISITDLESGITATIPILMRVK